jgi:hypothetical protein
MVIWHLLKPLRFYCGDPGDLIEPVEEGKGKNENVCMTQQTLVHSYL